MKCGACGQEGHNRRTCPNASGSSPETRDRALILRVDGMTRSEQSEMHSEIVKLKKRVTSDEAKATLVEGSSRELPSKIRTLIENKENE